jgi:hypothetical protein
MARWKYLIFVAYEVLQHPAVNAYRNFPILRTLVGLQHIFPLVNIFLPNFFNSSKHGRGLGLAI